LGDDVWLIVLCIAEKNNFVHGSLVVLLELFLVNFNTVVLFVGVAHHVKGCEILFFLLYRGSVGAVLGAKNHTGACNYTPSSVCVCFIGPWIGTLIGNQKIKLRLLLRFFVRDT
jgi:hypothetical protein